MKKNNKQNSSLQQIIANHTMTADIVKKAAEKYQKEAEEKNIERVTAMFAEIDRIEGQAVCRLREIREMEKHQKAKVVAINAAKENFVRTGDVDQLAEQLRPLGVLEGPCIYLD